MIKKILYRNFQLVYRLSCWLQRRFTHAGMLLLAGLITAGVFGLDTRQTLSFQIFTLLLTLLCFALLYTFTFRGKFDCTRKLPTFASVGERLTYRLFLHNKRISREHDLLLFDEVEIDFPDYAEYSNTNDPEDKYRHFFDRLVGYPKLVSLIKKKIGAVIKPVNLDWLAGSETDELKVSLLPLRRGYIRFNQIRIMHPDPFGLFRAQKKLKQEDSLLVLPKRYRLPPIYLSGKRKHQPGGINMSQSVGDSEEFFSLREYRPGDPLRAIHWRSYARKGVPVVKEYQDEYFIRQGLVLDTFLENRPAQILEEAISVAASFVTTIPQQDALLDMLFIGDEAHHFTSGRGLASTENMLEILACVEPCHKLPFTTLIRLIQEHAAGSSGFICIFLDWDKERQHLVNRLKETGLPVHVVVITTEAKLPVVNHEISRDIRENFWVLKSDHIQASLDATMSSP